jgi:hypothetical protein
MCGGLTRIVGQSIRYRHKLLTNYSFFRCREQLPGAVRRFAVPDPSLLGQLLDRQEITAVTTGSYRHWVAPPAAHLSGRRNTIL